MSTNAIDTPQAATPVLSLRPRQLWGLTGGIGSGKSTVAAMLRDLGAVVVDADALSKSLTEAGGAAMPQIAAQFGRDMVQADGALNRARMRELVFRDADAKTRLQQVLHPLIQAAMASAVERAFANPNVTHVVCDIPLLVESAHWRAGLSSIWVVDCDEATQVERVVSRSQLTPDQVKAIMANQATRAQRNAAADVLVYNQGIGLDELRQQVGAAAAQLGLS
jgi:dephospho-CoA kinase